MDEELEEYFATEKQIIAVLEQAIVSAAKPKPRKIEDFVNDMIHQGRTLKQVLIVAECTRWEGQAQRIKEIYYARAS